MKEITIGRSESSDIIIPATSSLVSRSHATIVYDAGQITYIDHSSNGSIINGMPLHNNRQHIKQGDRIELPGNVVISWNKINHFLPSSESATQLVNDPSQYYRKIERPNSSDQSAHYNEERKKPSVSQYRSSSYSSANDNGCFSFKGRCNRSMYWTICFLWGLGYVVFAYIFITNPEPILGILFYIFALTMGAAMLATNCRRCHDLGHSGWFQFIPFYYLWMALAAGDSYDNKFGPAD